MVLLSGIRIASSIRQPGVLQGSLFYLTTTTQSLHTSGVIYKKKQNSEGEDAFAIEDDDELFAIPADTRPQNNTGLSASQTEKLAANRAKYFQQSKSKLLENPAFRAYYLWREQSSGKNSGSPIASETVRDKHAKAKDPPRRAILSCMIGHASTRAELFQIVDVFSIYRAKQWSIDDLNRIDFIGRCINLKSPDIALAVLHHRPQFGIDIPSLSTGRALLHSLVITPYPPVNDPLPEHLALPTSTPFDHALLMANLFSLYALPPAESDEVARALLLGACAEQKGENLEIESVGAVMRKVREWIETQKTAEDAKAEGVILPTQGTVEGVKDGKLVMSAKAIKEGGKASIRKVTEVTPPSDNNKLSIPERQWIKHGLERFVNWAQEKGEDVAWVEKLKVQEA